MLKVNTLLGGTDFTKIESILSNEKEKAARYLKKELVFFHKDLHSKEEVIQFLGQKAVECGYADEEIIDSIFEREDMSPTCFGNLVAIPHPLVPQTKTTFWAVCTLKKPIDWENQRVQFVCLLCVEKENKADLQSMYKLLGSILDDPAVVNQLIKCRSYQELSDVFDQKMLS